METIYPDVLAADEAVSKLIEAAGTGKGKTDRARSYTLPIAVRFVDRHQQQQFEIQSARRRVNDDDDEEEEPANTPAPVLTPASVLTPATATTSSPAASAGGAIADDVFVDADWSLELEDIEVQELNGTWRQVNVFRHLIDPTRVCIWFGDKEYEGIDPSRPYNYCPRTEILEDDGGYDINWRVKGLDNDDDDDDDDDDDS